jgi:hypothetical protein
MHERPAGAPDPHMHIRRPLASLGAVLLTASFSIIAGIVLGPIIGAIASLLP